MTKFQPEFACITLTWCHAYFHWWLNGFCWKSWPWFLLEVLAKPFGKEQSIISDDILPWWFVMVIDGDASASFWPENITSRGSTSLLSSNLFVKKKDLKLQLFIPRIRRKRPKSTFRRVWLFQEVSNLGIVVLFFVFPGLVVLRNVYSRDQTGFWNLVVAVILVKSRILRMMLLPLLSPTAEEELQHLRLMQTQIRSYLHLKVHPGKSAKNGHL